MTVDMDGAVAGSIEGRAVRFKLSPSGSKVPVLNPSAAAQAGLKRGWLNVAAVVGPIRIKGSTAVIRYTAPGNRPEAGGSAGLSAPLRRV